MSMNPRFRWGQPPIMLLAVCCGVTGCVAGTSQHESFREWKEEVKLNDGRVILVNQKWRCARIGKYNTGKEYCSTLRESWLTFSLPEISNREIEWNEQFLPLVFNVYKGQLYIVGIVDGTQWLVYGKPQPPYISYRWNVNGWHPISFNEIPETIYKTNMATEFPPVESPFLFKVDAKERSNNRASLPKPYKRILPDLRFDADIRFEVNHE